MAFGTVVIDAKASGTKLVIFHSDLESSARGPFEVGPLESGINEKISIPQRLITPERHQSTFFTIHKIGKCDTISTAYMLQAGLPICRPQVNAHFGSEAEIWETRAATHDIGRRQVGRLSKVHGCLRKAVHALEGRTAGQECLC